MSLAHVVVLQIQNVRFSELRQQQPYTSTQLIYVSYSSHASDRIVQNQRACPLASIPTRTLLSNHSTFSYKSRCKV